MATPMIIEYTSMVNNTANGYSIIWLDYYPKASYKINKCNILKNKQKMLDTEGIIYTFSCVYFNDCCILANEANVIFYTVGNSYTVQQMLRIRTLARFNAIISLAKVSYMH